MLCLLWYEPLDKFVAFQTTKDADSLLVIFSLQEVFGLNRFERAIGIILGIAIFLGNLANLTSESANPIINLPLMAVAILLIVASVRRTKPRPVVEAHLTGQEAESPTVHDVGGYDLLVTDKRLVFLNPQYSKVEGMTLDQRLEMDKSSWSIAYDDLSKVTLTGGAANRGLTLKSDRFTKLKVFNDDKVFSLNKEQVERLRTILPTIPALAPKLKMKFGFWA